MARIWIRNPTRQNQNNYLSSRGGTSRVTATFERSRDVFIDKEFKSSGAVAHIQQKQYNEKILESILEHFDNIRRRAIMRDVEEKNSNWLMYFC